MKRILRFAYASAIVLIFNAVFASASNARSIGPSANITNETQQTICQEGMAVITFQAFGTAGAVSVTFGDSHGGVYTATGTIPGEGPAVLSKSVTLSSADTYTFTIISVTNNGNTTSGGTGSAVVIVNAPPTASFTSPATQTVCSEQFGEVDLQFSGSSAGNYSVTVQQSFTASGGGSNVSSANYSVPSGNILSFTTPTSSGTYTYTVTGLQDAIGCTGTFSGSATVIVEQPLAGGFTSTNPLCSSGTGTVTVWSSGGGGNVIYALCPATRVTRIEKNGSLKTDDECLCLKGSVTLKTETPSVATCGYQSTTQPIGGVYTFTGVAPGTYNVLVEDAIGCITTLGSVTITSPPPITSNSPQLINPTCFDSSNGSITLNNITGGKPPYIFSRDGGVNFVGSTSSSTYTFPHLHAGTYTIVIKDANGCTKQLCTVTLIQPNAITGNVSATSACETGTGTITVNLTEEVVYRVSAPASARIATCSTSLFVSGGIYGSGQQFYGQLQNVPPGTYTITGKKFCDANCGNVIGIVTVPGCGGFTGILGTVNAVCFGGSGTVNIVSVTGGTAPYKFSLDGINYIDGQPTGPTIINVPAGVYNVYVKDALGVVQILGTTTVTQPSQVTASITVGAPASCSSGGTTSLTVTASGGTGTFTYAIDGGTAQASNVLITTPGTHNIVVTDAAGCTASAAATVTGTSTIVLNTTVTNNTCNNGLSGMISVHTSGNTGTVTVTLRGPGSTQALTGTSVNFTGLAAGSYSITAVDANNCPAVVTLQLTQPVASAPLGNNNAPDLLLTSVINPPTATFNAGSTVTITYTISVKNNSNIAAQGVILRITKPFSGYMIQLTGGSTSQWMIITDNASFTEIQLKPGFAIPCSGSVSSSITISRGGFDSSSPGIPVTASVRLPGSDQDQHDQDNARSSQFRVQ